jgi:hypothetical protein
MIKMVKARRLPLLIVHAVSVTVIVSLRQGALGQLLVRVDAGLWVGFVPSLTARASVGVIFGSRCCCVRYGD